LRNFLRDDDDGQQPSQLIHTYNNNKGVNMNEPKGITSKGWAALRRSVAKTRGINLIKSTGSDDERRKGYLTFLPSMLIKQLQVQATKRDCSGGEVHPETIYQYGVVFFADLSGFTKLTEKLAVHAHGAELLCSELDKVRTYIIYTHTVFILFYIFKMQFNIRHNIIFLFFRFIL
jgi:hypothetical protein